jgi:hypothetical protein
MRTFTIVLTTVTLILGLTRLAQAGPIIATPLLDPPSGGRVSCGVANVSNKKNIRVTITVYDFNGNDNFGPATIPLLPLRNTQTAPFTNDDRQSHCIVEVIEGGKKNVRVSLMALDSSGNVVAAVNGQ